MKAAAEAMIGHTLITKQTGEHGRPVRRVYVEAGCDIARELYLSLLVDRISGRVTIIASTEGGMEIEEVSVNHPEKILRVGVDPASGISGFHSRAPPPASASPASRSPPSASSSTACMLRSSPSTAPSSKSTPWW